MNTIFSAITQTFIKSTLFKKRTRVLELVIFYETRAETFAHRVLSCVIYTIIKIMYVLIIWIVNQNN